ncbi:MAG: PAS domain S-box protein [Gammaproteobacteria bacterium]
MSWLRRLGKPSIRRQLMLGIVTVHAVLMSLLIFNLVTRQQRFLHEQALNQAISLTRSLAANSDSWVMANDLVGMEEILRSLGDYPELRYAMLVSPSGQVLAHTRKELAGRWLADPVSLHLLAAAPEVQVLVNTAQVVDIAAPILQDELPIGWARLGLGQKANAAALQAVVREGLVYTLTAIMIGALFALGMARRLTRGLRNLLAATEAVRSGRRDVRIDLRRGDEIGQLAGGFQRMIDALGENERRLTESEARFRLIFDYAPLGMALVDLEGRSLLSNRALCDILGYTEDELCGMTFVDFTYPDDAGTDIARFRELCAGRGGSYALEKRYLRKDGRMIWGELTAALIRDQAGGPLHAVRMMQDITARKTAEQEVCLLNQAIEQAPVSIVMTDPAGRITYVNPYFSAATGYSREEAIGKNPRILKSGETPDEEYRIMWEALGVKKNWTGVFHNRRKDGSLYWEHAIIAPLLDEQGAISGYVAVKEDITELKAVEQELEAYRRDLEALVEMRTAQLAQAKDAAEAANRAKSVFLSNMSHELRTPLNAILGFAQLMAHNERIPGEERRNLQIINKSGQHLLDLINDVLEISRIESGRLNVVCEPLNLHELLAGLADVMELRARDKGLTLRLDKAPNLPVYILSDIGKLRQIILNLLSNAVKYTERGGIVLSAVSTQRDDSLWLEIGVADSGVGIAAEELEQVFQPFFQSAYGQRVGQGTGLGLTISREYATLLDGELSAASMPGQGSVFRFRMPLRTAATPIAAYAAEGRVLGLAPGQPAYRILVAEDNPDNQRLIAMILERAGFSVKIAADGRQAVEQFQRWHPHFIWMDMRMPVMDGYTAVRHIRALPGGTAVRIAALTASAFREDRGAILAAGCDDVVSKPLVEERIFRVMGNLLSLRFRYGEAIPSETAEQQAEVDVAALPQTLRDELRAAADNLDMEAVRGVIAALRQSDAGLGAGLEKLLDGFRFDRISALCGD